MKRDQFMGLCVLLCLTAVIIFGVSGRPAKAPEAPPEEDVYQELLTVTPLAVVEGETISPNQRFLVRTAGDTGIYVSGVRVPEHVQVVDRFADEVLWEGDGMVSQSALWSPESGYLALARSARTWCSVTVIETENWTEWDFTLPDGSPIPEYTFLPDNQSWGVWQSESTLELTVGRGGGDGPQKQYLCILDKERGALAGQTFEPVKEVLSDSWDFNHDGIAEIVEVTAMGIENGGPYTLSVTDIDGRVLWEEEAYRAHMGWTSIFACSIDGQDYLIRYLPTMYQGWADYEFQIFFLNAAGGEQIFYENHITWDCNFRMDGHQYDVEALTEFLWDVRGYLENSTLLMSTEDGVFQSDIPGLRLQCYPFGDLLPLDSREALEEAVRQIEEDYKGEQGI